VAAEAGQIAFESGLIPGAGAFRFSEAIGAIECRVRWHTCEAAFSMRKKKPTARSMMCRAR